MKKTCQFWFGSCSLSVVANNAHAQAGGGYEMSKGAKNAGLEQNLGIALLLRWGWQPWWCWSWWTGTISDHNHEILIWVLLHWQSSNMWLTPCKIYQVLLKQQGGFHLITIWNLLCLETSDDRMACTLISEVDFFEAESRPEIPRHDAFSTGYWWMWGHATYFLPSKYDDSFSAFFTLSDHVIVWGEHPEQS